jgi:hypothetical protein
MEELNGSGGMIENSLLFTKSRFESRDFKSFRDKMMFEITKNPLLPLIFLVTLSKDKHHEHCTERRLYQNNHSKEKINTSAYIYIR